MKLLHPGYATELAAGKINEEQVRGGAKATGTVTFAANLVAGETLTINGVVFTAGGAGDFGFTVGADLTTTLTNIATKLNASADARVSQATYASSATVLTITHDTNGQVGNEFTLAASVGVVSGAHLAGGVGHEAITLDAGHVDLVTPAGGAVTFALPVGDNGQRVMIFLKAKGAGANAIVSGAFAGGHNKVTLDAAGKFTFLAFMGGAWNVIGGEASAA